MLAQNDMEELELKLRLEKELRSKLQRWRESEYKNAYTMEDWRKERDVMQKVRQSPSQPVSQSECGKTDIALR